MDNSLKIKDLHHTAAERGKRNDNKTQPKPPDSLRQGAGQAAGAAPTLCATALRVTAPLGYG